MSDNMNVPNFYFMDQVDDSDPNLLSFSIGEFWLYFYKQRLIGALHLMEKKAWFLKVTKAFDNDGFTGSHEIDQSHIEKCVKETELPDTDVTLMENYVELCELIFTKGCAEHAKHIDVRLMGNAAS